jgi:hypothetical protein
LYYPGPTGFYAGGEVSNFLGLVLTKAILFIFLIKFTKEIKNNT